MTCLGEAELELGSKQQLGVRRERGQTDRSSSGSSSRKMMVDKRQQQSKGLIS